MNWEAVAAIGQVLGAGGVIASLVYLTLQIRASTRASAVASKLVSARFQLDYYVLLLQHPELQDIMVRGRKDPASLSREDYHRFSNLLSLAFGSFSAAHFQFRNGSVPESDFLENLITFRYFIHSPGGLQWWNTFGKHLYGPEFIAVVNKEIRDAGAS